MLSAAQVILSAPQVILSAAQVILSAAKDVAGNQEEILRCAQNDRRSRCVQNDCCMITTRSSL
jgi:hypothetical protein